MIQPELSRARAKNSYLITHNYLNIFSKQSPSFNFSHNFHSTYLHLPSIFFSLSFSLLFLHCHVNVFSFSFRAFFKCKVASQSANFKIKSQFYWQNSEKVLRSSVPSHLLAEEELLILIFNTVLIFITNTLLVSQLP